MAEQDFMVEANSAVPSQPPRFRAALAEAPIWPPTPPETAGGCVKGVVAHPIFLPFLRLAEQVEAVMRYRGCWGEDGPVRIEEALRELSVSGPEDNSDLVVLASIRPSDSPWVPDVAWRVGLAQEITSAPGRAPGETAGDVELLAALDLRVGWRKDVREHVGRFLSGWSRERGPVFILTDDEAFITEYSDGPTDPTLVAPTSNQPEPRADRRPGEWSWALWMALKEAAWRPLWLSKWMELTALGLGFAGHAWISSFVVPGNNSGRAILTIVLVLTCLLLQERLWAEHEQINWWFSGEGKWADRRSTSRWRRVRIGGSAAEAIASCLVGSGMATLMDMTLRPTARVVAVDVGVALVSGLLTVLWLTWGTPRWAVRPFSAVARWVRRLVGGTSG